MAIEWPKQTKQNFDKAIIEARHTLHNSPQFCDGALAALLDEYPRDKLGIWTFADHAEGEDIPAKGTAPDLSGEELLEAVRTGRIWLNLRAANQYVDTYAPVGASIFDSIQTATGRKVMKRDMGILISSPGIHVHYHLDIPMVALFQIRGEKTVWFYPPTDRFASPLSIETIALREREEGLFYKNEFETSAQPIELKPGMGVTWPQTAPHRVQNGGTMNVSLSCEFMTIPALIKANAIYANGRLRRDFGASPGRAQRVSAGTVGKALLARIMKRMDRAAPRQTTPPASFTVDLNAPNCTQPLN